MVAPVELSVLLRLYTGKQKSPSVIVQDFCDYLQKYSRHYLQESPDLVMYLDDTVNTVLKMLEDLEHDGKVMLSSDSKGRKLAYVPQYFIDHIVQRYRDIDAKIDRPFPIGTELPVNFPQAYLKPVYITTDFAEMLERGERTNAYLCQLMFPDETPPILYPGSISPEKLLELALSKIRLFLSKDESRDYIQKRMMVANPGKELSIKNALEQFQTRPSESLSALKHSGDIYLFWNSLCSFIRQDFAKKTEKTVEEVALIQSVYITEYLNNHYKSRAQQNLQRQTALKNLELCFHKPPYYFDRDTIARFTDSRGVPLLGQYKSTDLDEFIKEKSGEAMSDRLPDLLVFRTEEGRRYFVMKEKVLPLVIRLCNDSRKVLKDIITREWYQQLTAYQQEPAMKNSHDFEKKVVFHCKKSAPLLHGLLNAPFIPLLAMDPTFSGKDSNAGFKLFDHGRLLPLSTLLMLNRQELLTDARILLPFWYTIPVISSILAFFFRPRVPKKPRADVSKVREETKEESESPRELKDRRKRELKQAAAQIEKKLVPEGSTLEAEMSAQLEEWNRTLNKEVKENLTEDVNSLIRDYVRKIIRTLKASSFDLDRVENLAEALVNTPSLTKIKKHEALLAYVKLYIVQLVSNVS